MIYRTSELVLSTMEASQRHAQSIETVKNSVDDVMSVSRNNAVAASALADTAEALSEEATKLRQLTEGFETQES